MMSKKLLYLMSFVLVLAVTGTASADTWDITVPDAGFDDYVLGLGDYIYIDDGAYSRNHPWKCETWAWITYMYYSDSLPALSPNNKCYTEGDIIYQTLNERFIEGGTYTLSVWAAEPWAGYSDVWFLWFTGEDYTNNLIEGTGSCPIGSWGQASLAYTATAADAGSKFGIKMRGNGYVAFDDVTLSYDGPPGNNPTPADGSEYEDDEVDLYWIAGYLAVEHDVYFGTNFDDVNDATTTVDPCNVYQGRQPDDYFPVWDVLVPGTTYYWRIDEVNDAEPGSPWKGKVWSFWLRPWEPMSPSPYDGALYQDPNVDLSWSAGFKTGQHQVFFGTDPGALDPSSKWTGDPTYDPGPLLMETTYYWQVKEYQPRGRTTLGPIWSFTTMLPTMGTILYEYWDGITPTTQSLSTLYNWPDFPGNPTGSMIFTSFEGPINRAEDFGARMQAWLYPPVTGDYKFWIATDDNGDLNLSTDANPANKQLISWVRPWAAPRNWADPDITPSGLIPLVAGQKYYIEGLMKERGGGDNIAVGWTTPLDDTIQVIPGNYLEIFVQWWAWDPSPADGEPEADRPTKLKWRAGSHAAQHQVYFGMSEASMTLRDTLPIGTEEYDPGTLDPGQTYYWKVTEVNSLEPASPWEGDVWSFTTALCITLEGMEDYNDRDEMRGVWTDGYASVGWGGIPLGPLNVASSGSNLNVSTAVGARTNSATGPIHGGYQAMVLRYDNDGQTYVGIPGEEEWVYDAA
ncbi:MAG: PA14 domain-containing protein, partial [Planctomycetota bacterium]